jgi:hypothetical protein
LRRPVIWRRNSHGTQSDEGSRFIERILTVAETCRQQRLSLTCCVTRSSLIGPSNLPLHFYLHTNLQTSSSLPPEPTLKACGSKLDRRVVVR